MMFTRLNRVLPLLIVLVVGGSALAVPTAAAEDRECERSDDDDRCEKWAAVYDDPELSGPWPVDLDNEGAGEDVLHRMAVSPTGDRVFTYGLSRGRRWAIVATDATTGDQRWVVNVEVAGDLGNQLDPTLLDIAVSQDGRRVYVTSNTNASGRLGDGRPLVNTTGVTTAYRAATGEKLWEQDLGGSPVGHRDGEKYDLHSEDAAAAIAVSPVDDRVYVTGYRDNRDTYHDLAVDAYEGATGTQEWSSTYDHAIFDSAYPSDKALPRLAKVSPDGKTLYVGGRSCDGERFFGPPCDFLLLAYQAHDPNNPADDGRLRWVRQIAFQSQSFPPTLLDVAGDGSRVYVVGRGLDPNRPDNEDVIAAYAASTGERAWVARYPGNRPVSLAVSPTEDMVVATGTIGSGEGRDYRTVAYDGATGGQLWSTNFDGGKADLANSVAVSPDGTRVYVTGTSGPPDPVPGIGGVAGLADMVGGSQATVALDAASGEQGWSARYQRRFAREQGRFVEVGPDGTVFTAGQLTYNGPVSEPLLRDNRNDWGIQAYEP